MNSSATQTIAVGLAMRTPRPARAPVSTHCSPRPLTSVKGEDELLKAAADDPADYEQLYAKHHARVLRLCRLLLSDPHEADDVTQDVFLKLFHTHRLDDRTIAWGPWLT